MPERPLPVAEKERIQSLDVLRGFALLGILAMNIGSFSMPAATYFDPTAYGDLTGLNGWIWGVTHVLADLKFMAIFSMLFGAGMVLMWQRAEAKGKPSTALHYRRVGLLIVFGLIHSYVFWHGDILFWYGTIGLVVFLVRKLRARYLIMLGLFLMALTSMFLLAGGLTTDQWPTEDLEEVRADMKPSEAVRAAEVEAYRGGWLDQMEFRAPEALSMQTETLVYWAAWRVGGLMLLGMALFKLGLFSARRSRKEYITLIALGILVGIPLILLGMKLNFDANWEAPYFFFVGLQFNYWASILVALAWVSGIMLICQTGVLMGFQRRLSAVGRTAFSNYILQTVLCTTIFYGHGFGLFGSVDRTGQLAIVVAVWALQLIISPLWLERYRYGPLEWLWRSLSYMKRQPFRREVAA